MNGGETIEAGGAGWTGQRRAPKHDPTRYPDDEQWTSSFSIDAVDPACVDSYRLRRPALIELRFCFSSSIDDALAALLPRGEQLWQGTVCAHPVRVGITQLPSDPP